jgi:hypothetical protein
VCYRWKKYKCQVKYLFEKRSSHAHYSSHSIHKNTQQKY